jgi:hypothetical protein
MPTKTGKPTRKEKSRDNKAAYARTRKAVGSPRTERAVNAKVPLPVRLPRDLIDNTVMQRKRGDRTDENCIDEILERISSGDTLSLSLELVGVSGTQWRAWVSRDYHGLKAKVALAWEAQADSWADDLLIEAESATAFDHQAPKLRIETKKWIMGRRNIRWSDKSTVVLEGGERPIRAINSNMTEAEAAAAYADRIKKV